MLLHLIRKQTDFEGNYHGLNLSIIKPYSQNYTLQVTNHMVQGRTENFPLPQLQIFTVFFHKYG